MLWYLPKGGPPRHDPCLVPRQPRYTGAAEEAVVLYTFLPEVFALVAPFEEEFHYVSEVSLGKEI